MKVPFARQRLNSYLMWSIQTTDLNNSNLQFANFRRDCPVTESFAVIVMEKVINITSDRYWLQFQDRLIMGSGAGDV